MTTKNEETEAEAIEEEVEIVATLTGMPIEIHIRRHIKLIFFLLFCLY